MFVAVLSNPLELFDYKKDVIVGLSLDTLKRKAIERVREFCPGDLAIEGYGEIMDDFAVKGHKEEDFFDFNVYSIDEKAGGGGALFVYSSGIPAYPDFATTTSEWISEREEIREMFGTILNLPTEVICLIQLNNFDWKAKVTTSSLTIEAKFHTLPINYFKDILYIPVV